MSMYLHPFCGDQVSIFFRYKARRLECGDVPQKNSPRRSGVVAIELSDVVLLRGLHLSPGGLWGLSLSRRLPVDLPSRF
jgi:hypothetical protein